MSRALLLSTLCLLPTFALSSFRSEAADPFDPNQYTELVEIFTEANAKLFMNAVGSWSGHRAMEGASVSSGNAGFDLGVEVSLTKLPENLMKTLVEAGIVSGSDFPASLPLPRIHLRKTFGKRASIGLSGIIYRDYRIYGGDLKYAIHTPEEGAIWALRLSYSYTKAGFVEANTFRPELVISKPLEFAEPYLAFGWTTTTGLLSAQYSTTGQSLSLRAQGSSSALTAALGLQLRIAYLLSLTLEGGYHSQGAHHLGTRVALRF